MSVRESLERRRSVKHFDPSFHIDDELLRALLGPVALSPSAFNLQHSRLIVVRDRDTQALLCDAAYRQPMVRECSAVVVVTADIDAHRHADRTSAGAEPNLARKLEATVEGLYEPDPTLRRDEAIRSGSLASMALMLMADELGLSTCPLIGFDPERVRHIVGVPDSHLCVLMVCVGRARQAPRPRTGKLGLEAVVRLERFEGPGLTRPESDPA